MRWSGILGWRIEILDEAKQDLSKLDKPIARLEDDWLCVLVVKVGHRRQVYRS